MTTGYRKDAFGYVHLKGLIKSGTVNYGADGSIFTLPAGYRPIKQCIFGTWSSTTSASRVGILTSGEVCAEIGHNLAFALDGVTFKAEQ